MSTKSISKKIEDKIRRIVENKKEEIIRFTQDILRIPSVNHPPGGDEKKVQEFIARKLKSMGLKVDIFCLNQVRGLTKHKAYSSTGCGGPPRDYRNRPNVVGIMKGKGDGKSLILAAHVDVVPVVKEDKWRHEPWGAEIENEKIYARGAVDDKGPLAAMLMAVECVLESGVRLKGDVIIESVIDEEFGGANGTLATIVKGYKADGVIVGEPTDMEICPFTYGCQCMEVFLKGKSVHPFEKRKGKDPIELGLKIYQALLALEKERAKRANQFPLLSKKVIPVPVTVPIFEAGTLKGGAMAEECRMELWFATLPDETQAGLLREIKKYLNKNVVAEDLWLRKNPPEIKLIGRQLEASQISLHHPLVENLKDAVCLATGKKADIAWGTSGDLFLYTNFGKMPALLFGPGQIHKAHGVDECIRVKDLITATHIYALMILSWCGLERD